MNNQELDHMTRAIYALEDIARSLKTLVERGEGVQDGAEVDPDKIGLTDELTNRAMYNRDNAAQLYGDQLVLVCDRQIKNLVPPFRVGVIQNCSQDFHENRRWVERATGKPVKFSPYGWVVDE